MPLETVIDRRWRLTGAPLEGNTARLYPGVDERSGQPIAIVTWPATEDRLQTLRALRLLGCAYHPALVPLWASGLVDNAAYAILDEVATRLPWSAVAGIPPEQRAAWLFAYADVARYLTARGLPLPEPEDAALRLHEGALRLLPLGSLGGPAGPTIDAGVTQLARRLFPNAPEDAPPWWSTVDALRAGPRPLSLLLAELEGALGRTAAPPPLVPPVPPFAGREHSLGRIIEALDQLTTGRGSAIVIGGGDGSGKSRLVDEAAIYAQSREIAVRRLRPAPNSYETFDGQDLLQLFDPAPAAPEPPLDDPRQRGAGNLALRIQERIKQISASRRLLLIVEDVDRLPQEVRRIIEQILPLADEHPLLLLITQSGEPQADLPRRLRGAKVIPLQPLDLAATTTLLQAALGPDGAAEPLPAIVLQRTGGNPLLIWELLLSSAAIAPGTRGLNQALALLPGGIGALVGHRLLKLQPGARRLLQTAALLGTEVDPELLETFEEVVSLTAWLASTVQLGTLTHCNGAWRFAHAAVARVIAASVGLGDLPTRHAAIAAALERRPGAAPARLAGHWLAAGDTLRGAIHARRAGDLAHRQGLAGSALNHYVQSADAFSSAADQNRQRELVEVTVALATVAGQIGDDRQGHRLLQALSLATTLQDPLLEAQLYGSVGAYHYAHGRLPQALNYLTRCLILADSLGREELALRPLNLVGQIFCAAGKLSAGLPYLTRGAAAAAAVGDQKTAARSWAYAAVAHIFRGELTAAEQMSAAARAAAAAAGAAVEGDVAAILGYGLAFAGRQEESLPLLERSAGRPRSQGDSRLQMLAYGSLGYIALARGDLDSAGRHLNRSLEIAGTKRTATLHLPIFQALRSMIALSSGNFTAAVRGVEEALDLAESTQQPLAQAICQQILCRVLLDAPNPDWTTGEYLLLESMTYYRLEGAVPFIATATADLGRVYRAQDHISLAESAFVDAIAQLETLGMSWDAAQVRAELAALKEDE